MSLYPPGYGPQGGGGGGLGYPLGGPISPSSWGQGGTFSDSYTDSGSSWGY
jgi:hypothetical protein